MSQPPPHMHNMQPLAHLCRDCGIRTDSAKRCGNCGSPRITSHRLLHQLSIAHIDCDAFYASIEKRDRPELRNLPVIVGGGQRGVVLTACYIARMSGVRSAMPMFKARRACPEAVIVRPDMKKYVAASREIRAYMDQLTPVVEPMSVDEAFLDLSGTERLHSGSPAETLVRFSKTIEERLGLSVSIGLSDNRFLAKLASDIEKPRGFSVLCQSEAAHWLADKPVGLIWGVGPILAAQLSRLGIHKIGHIQTIGAGELTRLIGTAGPHLFELAMGNYSRPVQARPRSKSVGNETTFSSDISDFHALSVKLRRLAERVSYRLKQSENCGRLVTLKLKTGNFRSMTRSTSLPAPTQLADRIYRCARIALQREMRHAPFRLIGVTVGQLEDGVNADPIDLVDQEGLKRAQIEEAIDRLRERFHNDIVSLGPSEKFDRKS